MKKIRFIHTADLHLDSPFKGLQYLPKSIFKRIQESTFSAFTKIVDSAISMNVDFVLICGDLYDGEDRSIKAQARLRRQMERLQTAGIEAFVLYGNHDHLGGNWTTIEMPPNVHLFSSEVEMKSYISKDGVKVHIYGFSYPERHVKEKRINDYKKIDGADLHIGMLHGHCEGSSTAHQPYAPFSISDLIEKKLDYWALGHIHKQQVLHTEHNPYIVYPGNIQGRHKKESGKKGCLAVELSEHETTFKQIETADIIWENLTLDATSIKTFSDLYGLCKKEIENLRLPTQGMLLQIDIENIDGLEKDALNKIRNGELLEVLQDGEEYEESFVWTYRIDYLDNHLVTEVESAFKQELEVTIAELNRVEVFDEATTDLFGHILSSRYLDTLSEEEKKELINEAEQMVYELLQSNT
ncbi:metallophosphoesterase [Heyndrickxia sporothermodurans]|uniref:DNA repair exonuclease n=1 Tax=Heyndrickxia sporothermodurans TaxID=46224 RepID=A0AB37HC70_9BACI|nr:DNA repair exonuclease [Heyndrickxia sporothermodurans]MBL5767572.1 DNA repair exonuclease [Heyndrickxia sporothermodurans]MBL5770552.1 DNA repair exonuclease [Heyndrickxia sporothermodurans]MBL5774241.1 DNA repair exonuclease [Heyndrickxia sporothermodurans]MBL5777707.1 DNA repair exonuclease [Heyndrickxia sporothermodurans]MBL5781477.1 DNA repair exonuclease [Heyndrickxia sporothermodurans]